MGTEREIKLRIADLQAIRWTLRKLRARVVRPRVHERNVLFDTPAHLLAKREQLLRIRTERMAAQASRQFHRCLVTFKRPKVAAASSPKGARHKVREEIELDIPDAKSLSIVFEALGLRPWFQYEKFRTTLRLPASKAWAKRLLIEIDETPIGVFLELEGPAKAIDRGAQLLGFGKSDYVSANYMDLYREYCLSRGEEPADMLFTKAKSKKTPGQHKKN
jgi:adenylate cyclase class 2